MIKRTAKAASPFILPREIGRAEEVLLSVEDVEKYWDEVIRG